MENVQERENMDDDDGHSMATDGLPDEGAPVLRLGSCVLVSVIV